MHTAHPYNNLSISRFRKGLISNDLDNYVAWLIERGYAPRTIISYLISGEHFLKWIKKLGKTPTAIDDALVADYRAKLCENKPENFRDSGNLYCGARRLVCFFRSTGSIPLETCFEHALLTEFNSWMTEQRGTAESTLETYSLDISRLLTTLGDRPEKYSAKKLRLFVLNQARGFSHSHTESIVTAVRMFVRFLIATKRCDAALNNAIPRLTRWRKATLPMYLEPELIDRVIAECDTSTSTGLRDRAILLLLARLALRASDVSGMQIQDINWHNARLRVCGKSRRHAYLPLPNDVGEAVLCYLDTARPVVTHRSVFCIAHAPYTPMEGHTVSHLVGRYIRRSGIDAPSHGAHLFRHSAATALLRQGMSLDSIGSLLRHRDLDTTAIYAKVDVTSLQAITLPWLEEHTSC